MTSQFVRNWIIITSDDKQKTWQMLERADFNLYLEFPVPVEQAQGAPAPRLHSNFYVQLARKILSRTGQTTGFT